MHPATVTAEPTTAEDAVVRLMMAMGRRFRTRVDEDTVDPAQAALLYVLKSHGSMRLGDLAEAMRLDASTVSRHVQQLGEHGLIDRVPDPEDGRARIIALSPSGRSALKDIFDRRRAVVTAAISGWSDADRDRLRDDLARLTDALAEP